jgi:hypothetical protein
MCGLGAMVETEGMVTGVAAEGEEIQLMAVSELAVLAYGFDVSIHGGK